MESIQINLAPQENNMKLLSFLAFLSLLGLGTVTEFHGNRNYPLATATGSAGQTTDGAFRDGLYLGRLTAERGSESHIASARWATDKDRASFTAGYRRGYNEFLTSRIPLANRERQAE
jgi:hypothetical protein